MPGRLRDVVAQNFKMLWVNLEEQLALHQHLKNVLLKEAELAADCSILELEFIQQRKAEIAIKVNQVEANRQQIVNKLSQTLNLKEIAPTLKQLANLANPEDSQHLLLLHAQLTDLINEIKELGKKTALTAKARMISLQDTTAHINKLLAYHTFYSHNGGIKNKPHSRFLSRLI